MDWSVTVQPTVEPVEVAEAQEWLRLPTTADNGRLTKLIRLARRWAEERTGRAFLQQTVEARWDRDEARGGAEPLWLPKPPFLELVSFTAYDEENAATAITSADYYVQGKDPALLFEKGGGWPSGRRHATYVTVFKAGYGTTADAVPEEIKTAVLMRIADLYYNRSSQSLGRVPHKNVVTAEDLLAEYRYGYLA